MSTTTLEAPAAGEAPPAARPRWSVAARVVGSLLLAWHLAAVIAFPYNFWTEGASPVSSDLMWLFGPYVQATFLANGYAFFAPNPGPSHSVKYQVEFDDGRPSQTHYFPNLQTHWPRLLYHRYFMLSEQWHGDFAPEAPPPEALADPQRMQEWRAARAIFDGKREAFERHLRAHHGADRVRLWRMERLSPSPDDFRLRGVKLDDPALYVNLDEPPPAPEGVLSPRWPAPPNLPAPYPPPPYQPPPYQPPPTGPRVPLELPVEPRGDRAPPATPGLKEGAAPGESVVPGEAVGPTGIVVPGVKP